MNPLEFYRKDYTIVLRCTNDSLHSIWYENMLGYLFTDIICSKKRTVFPRAKLVAICELSG